MFAYSHKRIAVAAAALSLGLSLGVAGARAADAIYDTPPAPSAPAETLPLATWTGIYTGATLGYGFGHTDLPTNSIDTGGFVGGLFGGAQYQFDSVVVGGEADVGYNFMDGSNAGVTAESGLEGSLRARLGYAVTDRVLVFGTGGVAAGRVEVSNAAGSDANTMVGWTAGAGVDVKMTDRVFGRLEYRHTNYGDKTFTLGGTSRNVDVNQNRLMLGVGVQF